MLRAVLFTIGLCLTVAGVALWSVPAALILAGVELCTLMWQIEKTKAKAKPRKRTRTEEDLL